MRLLHVRRSWLAALSAVAAPVLLSAQIPTARVDSTLIAGLRWRNVGPANMGGRVVDVQGIPAPSRTFFVSTATGGCGRPPTRAPPSGWSSGGTETRE